ncbi:glycine betaine ABC transporter substrate-binding protein [Microvirga sp. 17 mud 1-3]|uniref:glycine betaine ABC transporter substrate-binding protein n=1 Tax=Microvirga sp. 17 mud 1-3 TaxID=2082949 RepID=UPI000D6AB2DE|nr:glycine betaine ABC transporter substrate-binding protein [Microvirga sp. 17 mud 1-3]AWM85457.1 glycine/betaine ABC transporter substrate-binding protein [Microvirga sp. 17 mud 1-3]
MLKTFARIALAAALTTGLAGTLQAEEKKPVKIGWTAWADAEFVTKLAKKLIEDNYSQKVELLQTDIAPQYQGVAKGDIDAMMMAWLPETHKDYWKRVGDKAVTLGVLYTDAKLGWVVPNYVPEDQVASISDLAKPEVKEKLNGKIQGIDPGAGLTRLSKEALKTYDLSGYDLTTASDAAMVSALDRAIRRKEWIVVTGWSPHWMFGKYELRYLNDPKQTLGGVERVYAIARQGFQGEYPEVAQFLMRMHLPLSELEAAMSDANESTVDKAIENYISEHPTRVKYWLTGEMKSSS